MPTPAPALPQGTIKKPIRRILIVGVSGYVGSALALGLRQDFEVFGLYNTRLIRIDGVTSTRIDLGASSELLETLSMIDPDCIIYCANFPFEQSVENPVGAELLHFKIPSLFYKMYRRPFTFLYFSTSLVYGQEAYPAGKSAFTEKDLPTPKTVFGTTKFSGEGVVLGNAFSSFVFRVATIYGETMGGVYRARRAWTEDLHAEVSRKHKVTAYTDQMRSFVYIGDVVRATKIFLQNPPKSSALYHMGYPAMSRYDLAMKYAHVFKLDKDFIAPAVSTEVVSHPHLRPRLCAIDSKKFETEYNFQFQSPDEGLAEMYERLRTGFSKNWP